MKRLLLLPVLCIFGLGFTTSSYAFLGDDFSLDMYENIDEGIDDLENTIYKKHLKTDRTGNIVDIKDKINQLTDAESFGDCFIKDELTSTDIENIGNGRIDKLFEVIGGTGGENDNCKIDDALSTELIMSYYSKAKALDTESRQIAEEQAKAISEIARVGIYSDGNDQNSPFDLINDLQDINNIIFSSEIPYLGVNSENNNEIFECLAEKFEGLADDFENVSDSIVATIEGSINSRDAAYRECENNSSSQNYGETFELEGLSNGVEGGQDGNEGIDFYGTSSDGNTLVCQDSSVSSGLSPEQITELIESTSEGRNVIPISTFLPEEAEDGDDTPTTAVEYPESTYTPVKDNDIWPCNEYFCIQVDFETKNYELLIGGETKSIESLTELSNKHLKIAANTVLVQSKQTINNNEMGWRDLSLPDMFHAGVQIQFIPPPILNLDSINGDPDKKTNALGDDWALDNLLATYFSHKNMEYDRQNDLEVFQAVDRNRSSVINGQDLSISEIIEEFEQARKSQINSQTDFTRQILDKTVHNDDISDLALQFAEIERFSIGIRDYTIAAAAIIQKMKEIPIYGNG